MFENINPEVLAVAGTVFTVAIGAGYAYFTGNEASVDVDGDGEDDITFEGDSNDSNEEESTTEEQTEEATEEQSNPNPTPAEVQDIGDDLTEVTGVGPTREEALNNATYDTAADLYYASDEGLESVHGLGPKAVEDIRADIGGIDEEGNESSSSTDTEETTDESSESNSESTETEGDSKTSTSETSSESTTEETGTGDSTDTAEAAA